MNDNLINMVFDGKISQIPVWFLRQAGRHIPEYFEIRKKEKNFIDFCLNENLIIQSTKLPLKYYDLDAAIVFSDILMVPYGLNQSVNFKKNYGPILGDIEPNDLSKISHKNFTLKLNPVYESLKTLKKNKLLFNKDLIGFVGGPWTILVYMLNKKSPKRN